MTAARALLLAAPVCSLCKPAAGNEHDCVLDICKILLGSGADPIAIDRHGKRPVDIAEERGGARPPDLQVSLMALLREASVRRGIQTEANISTAGGASEGLTREAVAFVGCLALLIGCANLRLRCPDVAAHFLPGAAIGTTAACALAVVALCLCGRPLHYYRDERRGEGAVRAAGSPEARRHALAAFADWTGGRGSSASAAA